VDVDYVLTLRGVTAKAGKIVGVPRVPGGYRGLPEVPSRSPPEEHDLGAGGRLVYFGGKGVRKLEVRVLLATDDEANILVTYTRIAVARGSGGMDTCIAPLFEAPEGPHSCFNDIEAIGYDELVDGSMQYDIYALR